MGRTRLALVFALAAATVTLAFGPVHAQESPDQGPATAAASPSPPPIPSPKPGPDDPKRHKLVVQQFLAWQQGQVDRSLYADSVNDQLTDDVLNRGTATLANMGALQSAVFLGTSHTKGVDLYVYKVTCEHGSVDMDFALAPDGKIELDIFRIDGKPPLVA